MYVGATKYLMQVCILITYVSINLHNQWDHF